MEPEAGSRTAVRLAAARKRAESLPGGVLTAEVLANERDLGGGLIAGGVAFRVFLWIVPFGLVVATLLSFWSDHDREGFEDAARSFGVSAAATGAATEALEHGDRNAGLVLAFGLVLLVWFTLGALRALVLSYALAWQLKPPRLRRPVAAILLFNGLFALYAVASAGVVWLRVEIGATALLSTVATIALATGIALCAMLFLPHRARRPRELLPGALLIAVGDHVLHVAVLFYFAPRLGRAEETYGAFGAAATILVWLYVIARLATGAAFLNATLWARSAGRPTPDGADFEWVDDRA